MEGCESRVSSISRPSLTTNLMAWPIYGNKARVTLIEVLCRIIAGNSARYPQTGLPHRTTSGIMITRDPGQGRGPMCGGGYQTGDGLAGEEGIEGGNHGKLKNASA